MENNTKNNTSVFGILSRIDVSGKTEKIGQLTYLSWPWAWGLIKENFPEAFYTIYENSNGWPYHTDGRTAWVKTGVTINGLEHIEYLPVMDNRHNSIPLDEITSRDVNDNIQRSLTKAAARHGLGLNVYAGQDLLMFHTETSEPAAPKKKAPAKKAETPAPAPAKKKITAEMLDGAFVKALVQKLNAKKGDADVFHKACEVVRDYYEWDALNTYFKVVEMAKQ